MVVLVATTDVLVVVDANVALSTDGADVAVVVMIGDAVVAVILSSAVTLSADASVVDIIVVVVNDGTS